MIDNEYLTPSDLNLALLNMTKESLKAHYGDPISVIGDIKDCKVWKRSGMSFKVCYEGNAFECKVWTHSGICLNSVLDLEHHSCIVTGTIGVDYFQHHKFTLVVSNIEMIDQTHSKFTQLKTTIQTLELDTHKKHIPWTNVQKIGIISKKHTQGYTDFVEQFHILPYELFEISLEGDQTSDQCIQAIDFFNNSDVDLVLILRGGGSTIDISNSFDHIELFTAMRSSAKPVLTAIGHEKDKNDHLLITTISDLDFPTPSSAAFELSIKIAKPLLCIVSNTLNEIVKCFSQRFEVSICSYYDALGKRIEQVCSNICSKKIIEIEDEEGIIIQKNDQFFQITQLTPLDVHIPTNFGTIQKQLFDGVSHRDINEIENALVALDMNFTKMMTDTYMQKIKKIYGLQREFENCTHSNLVSFTTEITLSLCNLTTLIGLKKFYMWVENCLLNPHESTHIKEAYKLVLSHLCK